MQSSFEPTFGFTLGVETGQISLSRDDDGNWTGGAVGVGTLIGSKYGVSATQLEEYLDRPATRTDMAAVTPDVTRAVFGGNFWNRCNGDKLPPGVDLMTVDHSYNRGPSIGARVLQRLLGQAADGWIGAETLAAVSRFDGTAPDASLVDVRALQEGAGVAADGVLGAGTRAAFAALPASERILVALYAAQVKDYHGLAAAPRNPGWFTRARTRLAAARRLGAAA